MSPFQASALVGCMRPHALFRVEGSEGAGMGGGGRGWGRDGEGRGGTGRGGEGGGAHARGAGAQQRPRGLRSRPCESTSPRGRAHTILERVRGGPPSEPRREHRHIAIPPCFRALRRFLPQCFFAPFGASRQQHRPPNAPRALPKVGAVWLRGRCQLGSRMRPYEFMSARGRAPTVPVGRAGGRARSTSFCLTVFGGGILEKNASPPAAAGHLGSSGASIATPPCPMFSLRALRPLSANLVPPMRREISRRAVPYG